MARDLPQVLRQTLVEFIEGHNTLQLSIHIAVGQLLHSFGIPENEIPVQRQNAAGLALPDILGAAQPFCLAGQNAPGSDILICHVPFDLAPG